MAGGTALNRRSRRTKRSTSCENRSGMSHGWILVLMGGLFLGLGYLGVPVAFSITAGVLVATMLTPISLPSIIGQLFNEIGRASCRERGQLTEVGALASREAG